MPVAVRRAVAADYDSVADLTATVYLTEGYGEPGYETALRDVASRNSSGQVLIAESDNSLVGAVAVATRGGPWAEQSAPGEAVIRMLAVAPSGRGNGAGQALVDACVEVALADGCAMVRLSTMPVMTAAHRLYERRGFVRTASFDWEPVPGLTLLAYALPLVPWCDQCGEPLTPEGHNRCRRALDPPRYCRQCRRRMVVQVTPTGWSARCVEHGLRTSD